MSYVNENFQDLDVMNNFMFNRLTTEPEIAQKFCRRMVKSLLNKELGEARITSENIILPDDPNKRGVRLDVRIDEFNDEQSVESVYDIEPHRQVDNKLPKRTRYVQAQIDKNGMNSGDRDFSHMSNLYIVNITNYDPFGYDRLVYTIDNLCIEVPELEYDDGVEIYYFNTSGKVGGDESLRIFLKFLEESTSENAIDEATSEVASYIEQIKSNSKIEGDYMTLGDWIDDIADEVRKDARAEGLAEGRAEGIAEGRAEGRAEGIAEVVKSVVLRMHNNGKSIEDIMIATDLSQDEIKEIADSADISAIK